MLGSGPGRVLRRLRVRRATAPSSRASRASGSRCRERCRIVDARYLAPDIPAETPPQFEVADGARVIPVNDLVRVGRGPEPVRRRRLGQDRDRRLHLAAGARGGPRRDLLGAAARPVDAEPGADPAGSRHLPRHGRRHDAGGRGGGVAATTCSSRLEDAGIMLRIDRSVTPTMAKAPTLGDLGARPAAHHRERRTPRPHRHGAPRPDRPRATGRSRVADDALVVNCAADGLKMPPLRADLGAGGDHPAADPGRVPVLRGRARRVRRGDPRRRRREEPALPAVVVRQHPDRLGDG